MNALHAHLRSIQPRQALALAVCLILARVLDDVLSDGVKEAVEVLLLGTWSLPEILYRAKSGTWPHISQPLGYISLLGWLAAMAVWALPPIRRDHLPPSPAIDVAILLIIIAVLASVLSGIGKASRQ